MESFTGVDRVRNKGPRTVRREVVVRIRHDNGVRILNNELEGVTQKLTPLFQRGPLVALQDQNVTYAAKQSGYRWRLAYLDKVVTNLYRICKKNAYLSEEVKKVGENASIRRGDVKEGLFWELPSNQQQ